MLACGPSAVLSHRSAAALLGSAAADGWARRRVGPLTERPQAPGRGIRVHRRRLLPPQSMTVRDLIPVTTPSADDRRPAGRRLPTLQRRALRQAEVQRFALGPANRGDRTRSDLERRFLRLCRRNRLPTTLVNVRIGRWTVDFLWPERRVVVETDSWRFHGGSVAFEDDHARDRRPSSPWLRGAPLHRTADSRGRRWSSRADLAAALL